MGARDGVADVPTPGFKWSKRYLTFDPKVISALQVSFDFEQKRA
jgi:hypothetical protein